MPELPEGSPAPESGALDEPDVSAGFSAYVHVPFCAVRCGYCDFNTYTADFGAGASRADIGTTLAREIAFSRGVLEGEGPLLDTVFFGGGTPTSIPTEALTGVLSELERTFGLRPGAEVTTEANPESVTQRSIAELARGGFTRFSFGMQSADPSVLATLDRAHTPGQVTRAVAWARAEGLQCSVDLIYGAPGETMDQWRSSVEAALSLEPDHVSAYALTIEPGTRMGVQLARGLIEAQDPDVLAEKYEIADTAFTQAGYPWYEISNWARPGFECRHNMVYWRGGNWWGYGPGAHSAIGGTRFWNVKHPAAYAARIAANHSPAAAREVLTADERREEAIMLGIRLREGMDSAGFDAGAIRELIADGLIDEGSAHAGRIVLTRKGRLLADAVTRTLWDA